MHELKSLPSLRGANSILIFKSSPSFHCACMSRAAVAVWDVVVVLKPHDECCCGCLVISRRADGICVDDQFSCWCLAQSILTWYRYPRLLIPGPLLLAFVLGKDLLKIHRPCTSRSECRLPAVLVELGSFVASRAARMDPDRPSDSEGQVT